MMGDIDCVEAIRRHFGVNVTDENQSNNDPA